MTFKPAKSEDRICFGLAWFTTEKEALAYGVDLQERGVTVNGGFMDGMLCGRAPQYDHDDPKLGRLYAVMR